MGSKAGQHGPRSVFPSVTQAQIDRAFELEMARQAKHAMEDKVREVVRQEVREFEKRFVKEVRPMVRRRLVALWKEQRERAIDRHLKDLTVEIML